MYWVYVIKSESGRHYTGHTGHLGRRLQSHNDGASFWTARERGWKLIYVEEYTTRSQAMRREKELKSGKGRDELKRIGVI